MVVYVTLVTMIHVRFLLSIEYTEPGGILRMEIDWKKNEKVLRRFCHCDSPIRVGNELRVLSSHQFAANILNSFLESSICIFITRINTNSFHQHMPQRAYTMGANAMFCYKSFMVDYSSLHGNGNGMSVWCDKIPLILPSIGRKQGSV